MNNFLIYGSYGYTGQLIVEQARKKGLQKWLIDLFTPAGLKEERRRI